MSPQRQASECACDICARDRKWDAILAEGKPGNIAALVSEIREALANAEFEHEYAELKLKQATHMRNSVTDTSRLNNIEAWLRGGKDRTIKIWHGDMGSFSFLLCEGDSESEVMKPTLREAIDAFGKPA